MNARAGTTRFSVSSDLNHEDDSVDQVKLRVEVINADKTVTRDETWYLSPAQARGVRDSLVDVFEGDSSRRLAIITAMYRTVTECAIVALDPTLGPATLKDLETNDEVDTLSYIFGMCARLTSDMSEDKLNRWLGYVQGVAVARGWLSLEDCKCINRKTLG